MTMSSETANRYFQGKENIAIAIARRRIKAGGDVKAALAIPHHQAALRALPRDDRRRLPAPRASDRRRHSPPGTIDMERERRVDLICTRKATGRSVVAPPATARRRRKRDERQRPTQRAVMSAGGGASFSSGLAADSAVPELMQVTRPRDTMTLAAEQMHAISREVLLLVRPSTTRGGPRRRAGRRPVTPSGALSSALTRRGAPIARSAFRRCRPSIRCRGSPCTRGWRPTGTKEYQN